MYRLTNSNLKPRGFFKKRIEMLRREMRTYSTHKKTTKN